MANAAISAYGTLLKMIVSPGAPVLVAGVTNITGPGFELGTVEVTPHEAAGDGWREYIATLKDGQEVSGTINFLPSREQASGNMLHALANATRMDFEITWPEAGKSVTFSGFVTGFNPSGPTDGALTADFTLKVDGKVTLI